MINWIILTSATLEKCFLLFHFFFFVVVVLLVSYSAQYLTARYLHPSVSSLLPLPFHVLFISLSLMLHMHLLLPLLFVACVNRMEIKRGNGLYESLVSISMLITVWQRQYVKLLIFAASNKASALVTLLLHCDVMSYSNASHYSTLWK